MLTLHQINFWIAEASHIFGLPIKNGNNEIMKHWLYIVFVFVAHLTAAQTVYYVNDNTTSGDAYCNAIGDDSNDGLTASNPKATLSNVISTYGPSGLNLLTSGDVIYVDAGMYYQTDANLSLNINGLSIIGAGSDLTVFDNDAASSDANRWANLTADNVIIEGLFITGYNYGVADAIALQIDGAQNFAFTDIRVNENLSGGGSSAVFITGSSTGSFNGGSASCNPPNPSLAGGGVNVEGNGNIISFTNFEFSNNSKDLSGGAGIRINGDGTTDVSIMNSIFEGNETNGAEGGGAIFVLNGAQLDVTGCCFLGNNASQASSANYGGAINLGQGSDVIVSNCSFDGNFASSSGNGGAIAVNSTSGSTGGTPSVDISYCSFSNNAAADGNDIFTRGSKGAIVTVFECTWSSTSSEELHIDDGNITIENSGNPDEIGGVTFTNTTVSSIPPSTACPQSGGTCYTAVVLPVELISFEGVCEGSGTELTWQTASEYNSAFFIVERAGVEGQFEIIEKIPGSLNSSDLLTYYCSDEHPLLGINYYRLLQVDVDGNLETFGPITVNNNCDDIIISYLANHNSLYFHSQLRRVVSVSVVNMAGQLIENIVTDPSKAVGKLQLKYPLAEGVYYLIIDNGGVLEIGKVLVTR